MFRNTLCEITNDRSVRVEKIVSSHSWFTGNTGGDKDDVCAFEGGGKTVAIRFWNVAGDLKSVSPIAISKGSRRYGASGEIGRCENGERVPWSECRCGRYRLRHRVFLEYHREQ